MSRRNILCFLIGLICLAALASPAGAAPVAKLADNGRALLKVIVAENATDETRQAAIVLADYLSRIASAKFEIAGGDGSEGIAFGLAGDFPALKLEGVFNTTVSSDPAAREQYLLRSHTKGLYILARQPQGVPNALWDVLYRLGHRQFFPGAAWEIVPSQKQLTLAVDTLETPDYVHRRIWYGYGVWDHNAEAYQTWQQRNRAPGAFVLTTGHVYDEIIRRNKTSFAQHPEFYALVNGERKGSKLCISNPALRELVVADALKRAEEAKAEADTISMEPSDGGGWCECEACQALGNPADRCLMLANQVAEALEAKGIDKWVAFYAYNEHGTPPTRVKAHPRIVISAATGFLLGKTIDQVLEGWKKTGVTQFGIREYYSIFAWDHDLPGQSRGANLDYLHKTIPAFYQQTARLMSAESGDNWGCNGLGYYLATRMMWDVKEADRVEELKADFLEKAFGPARSPMEKFYRFIDGAHQPLVSEDLVGRMYRALDEAMKLAANDPAVRQRLDHLLLYTRYVELYRAYEEAGGSARQKATEQLIQHAYRIRSTMMVHAKGVYRGMRRDKTIKIPPEAVWSVPEGKNPWKSSQPWEPAELQTILAEGIRNNQVVSFQTLSFSRDLDRSNLKAPTGKAPAKGGDDAADYTGRSQRIYYVWIDQASDATPARFTAKVTGGLIAHYRNRGPARLELVFAPPQSDEISMSQAQSDPDGVERELTLSTTKPGLHKLLINDGNDMTKVSLPANLPWTVEMSAISAPNFTGSWGGVFYVPKGAKIVGGFANARRGQMLLDGKVIHEFKQSGYFEIPVPPSGDGKVWELAKISGNLRLMTVPPYISPTPGQLLLPREVR